MSVYHYWAEVTSVYDGDTITVNMDLGFGLTQSKVKIRLHGINTPEIRGGTAETKAAGRASRDYVRELILGKWVIIHTLSDKKGKYGRYIADVYVPDEDGKIGESLNRALVQAGLAQNATY